MGQEQEKINAEEEVEDSGVTEHEDGPPPKKASTPEKKVREVYGSSRNIRNLGSPGNRSVHESIRFYFYPTWRSQLLYLLGFFLTSVLCVVGSYYVPVLVVPGNLFTIYGTTIYLYFPVLILIPGYMLGKVFIHVYDAKYIIDEGGVEAQIGLVSFNLRQPRLRWEDIRGSEPQQTIWERMVGIGSVLIGSAMTQDVEIVMSGVGNPRAIQLLIQGERERRMKDLRAPEARSTRLAAATTD